MKFVEFVLAFLGCLQYFVAADFQVDALYEMRMNLSDSRGVLKGWNNNQMSPCYWVNINCQDNNVISITLSSSGLSGVLSPSIAKLTTLQQLLLDGNSITGEIPEEFGNLSSLTTLKLGRNYLNGHIPDSLGHLSNLQNLLLDGNSITGEIPEEFGNLSSLTTLKLERNYLNGHIPDSLGHLSNLQNLDLSANLLIGNIPSSLSNLSSLNDINLADNYLRGEIPKQLLQVAKYNYTGNLLNCGQHLFSCDGGSTQTGNHRIRKLWIGATVLSLAAAFTCFTLCFGWIRRHRKDKLRLCNRLKVNVQQDEELEWGIEQTNSEFTIFHFSQVSEATKMFSEENKLGQGGFGPMYKGQFVDGLEIAVKRLASCSGQGLREFKNEVQLIAKLQHRNLVRLLGCCSQGEDKMLVYEYLPNKSLDFFIFDETRRTLLGWNKHLMIIEGIAQGLLYLHKHSRLRVVHRDVKASNILLDSEMNPKISDFGLARMFSSDDTDGNTKRVVGTYGYMAPEYASEGLFSTKSDVFSFGVLILEIVTGKRNSRFHQHEDFLNLLGYAWQLWREGRWLELVDALLVAESRHTSEMMRCINIALLCVQETADDRPTMSDVVVMLSSTSMILPEPKQPAYFHVRVAAEETSTADELCSANDVTISSPRGR